MNFENPQQEKMKSAKEGGLEMNIEKLKTGIETLTDMVNQIEHLQKVPFRYKNLGSVDKRELPALDQFVEYRGSYETRNKITQEKLDEAYSAMLDQLSMLRDLTGIQSRDEALLFDKNTGRQDKDL